MKVTYKVIRFISRHTWWWTFAFLILLAVLLSAARLLLPQLGQYKQELEIEISQIIGQPVSIAEFEIGWHGYGPRLFLHDVQLLDRAGGQVLFAFNEAHIDASLPLTLYRAQVALQDLTLDGIELTLVRQADGRFSLGEMALPQAETESDGSGGAAVFDWLFRQKTLAIENSTLYFHDKQRDNFSLTVRDVNLYLRNDGSEHFLGGRVFLPSTLGGRIEVMAQAQGEIGDYKNWLIDFYAEGTGLELVQWLVDQPNLGMRMVNGTAEVELWGSIRQGQLDNLKGYLMMRDAYLAPDQPIEGMTLDVQKISSLFGEFVWQGRDEGWSLDVDRLRLVMDEVAWTPSRIHVEQSVVAQGQQLEVAASFARLDDISSLMALSSHLSQEQRQILLTTKPRGELHAGYLRLQLAENEVQDYFVRGELKNLALLPWKKLPGFDGLDLSLNLNKWGGVADLSTRGAYLEVHNLFRDYFVVDEMLGRLAWQQQDEGMVLELRQLDLVNPDAAVSVDGQVFLPADKSSPLVKLLLDIKRGNGSNTSRYLPAKKMPGKSVEWLDRAIVAGDVTSGAMVLQGPIKRFPFNDGSGRFEIRFNVSNGILDYREDWPRIEQIETEVAFIGSRMDINAVAGKVLASDINYVGVDIPDMRAKPAVLNLQGQADGSLNDVLRFLNQSPLRQRFGNVTEDATAEGDSRLDLSLHIPLGGTAQVETQGKVSVENGSIDFTRMGVDLSELSGQIEFSADGLSAQSVSGKVMGQPATVNIFSEVQAQQRVNMVFEAMGQTRYEALAERLDLFVFPYLEGSSQWRARLEIPRSTDEVVVSPSLKLTSDLQGTAIHMPAPLQKAADEAREFELLTRFEEQGSHWFFDYQAETVTGAFQLWAEKGLAHGEIRLGATAELPQKKGLRISGVMDHFVYDQWQPLLQRDEGEASDEPAVVNQLDLHIGTVELFGQSLHDVQLDAEHAESLWVAEVKSKELTGKVWLPDNWNNVLEMDLEHLYLARAKDGNVAAEEEPFDPNALPPLVINSKQTRYGNLGLGQVALVTRKQATGLRIEKLTLSSDILDAKIEGVWLKAAKHHSVVSAELNVRDLGSLLGGLGYVETVKHGQGLGQLNLSWDGPLPDYDLASLDGTVDFDFEDGSLLEVEPGAGRFFGLLSISALPRRLMLDFSDFFGKGFAFDHMRGHFDIKDGNAFTENFEMDGPAARIELQGRVGLLQEDYDQRVKVVPHVTSGLPTLAGILTGQIAPAVVLALIEKITKPGVDKATGIYYQVSGSWDEPVVEPVELAEPAKQDSQAGKADLPPK